MTDKINNQQDFVAGFRHSAPYIHAHRGSTFVVLFGGEAVAAADFASLIHDIALLHSLGIRLVLVHGARPQIEQRLKERGTDIQYVNGLRVTDDAALVCVKEAAGTVRVDVEALLSMGLANTPMAGARIRVTSGNFVTAKPMGVRDGVDYCHTGEVRRIDSAAINQELEAGRIVLLSPLGYSPTGEIFNVNAEDIATAVASELRADKYILLLEEAGPKDSKRGLIRQLTTSAAEKLLASKRKLSEETRRHLNSALAACRRGVRRAHLLDRHEDGTLLTELFTRDGTGTMITAETYEGLRTAGIDDVGGILELIEPLEAEGILMRRSRELLEMEIERFLVVERDGTVIACSGLYIYPDEKVAELACLAVHPDYQSEGRGEALLHAVEAKAAKAGVQKLFVLTTRTAHWFRERGFKALDIAKLPVKRRELYNYQRKSKVFAKKI